MEHDVTKEDILHGVKELKAVVTAGLKEGIVVRLCIVVAVVHFCFGCGGWSVVESSRRCLDEK